MHESGTMFECRLQQQIILRFNLEKQKKIRLIEDHQEKSGVSVGHALLHLQIINLVASIKSF